MVLQITASAPNNTDTPQGSLQRRKTFFFFFFYRNKYVLRSAGTVILKTLITFK